MAAIGGPKTKRESHCSQCHGRKAPRECENCYYINKHLDGMLSDGLTGISSFDAAMESVLLCRRERVRET